MPVPMEEASRFGIVITDEDGKITEFLTARPEFILISTEVRGYRKEAHTAEPEAREAFEAGDTFLVDHIRVFEKR